MKNRVELTLAACEGMTNEDLAKRGIHGFPKMIDRKRKYAFIARTLAEENQHLKGVVEALKAEIKAANAKLATIEALDKPVTDTSEAEALLSGIFKNQKS